MQKILIVEDDEKLRSEIKLFLSKNGYIAESIDRFNDTINSILSINSDLILLDINLPFCDGQYILKELRRSSDIPVIMITSRESDIDELLSMNYGADDYVTKPFNIQILLAKIYAILKRANKFDLNKNLVHCENFSLDISKSIIEKDGKTLELTRNEFKILHYLIKKKGCIVSREEIMEYLWDSSSFIDDNTLTVNITRLKKKLEDIDLKEIIVTKRGQGYILK